MSSEEAISIGMEKITQELILENEKKANRFNMFANIGMMILLLFILAIYGLIADEEDYALTKMICATGISINLLAILMYYILKPESPALKYVFMILWACFASAIAGLSGSSETYTLFFPIFFSVSYFKPRMTIHCMMLMLFMLFVSKVININWGELDVGLMVLPENLQVTFDDTPDYVLQKYAWDKWATFKNILAWQVPSAFCSLLIMGLFLAHIAKVGLKLMYKQARLNLDQRLAQVEEFKSDLAAHLLNINNISDSFNYVLNRLCTFAEAGWVSIVQIDNPENCWISTCGEKPNLDCCKKCPLAARNGFDVFDAEDFFEYTSTKTKAGMQIPESCPAETLISRLMKVGDKPWGVLALHYCGNRPEFSQEDRYVINTTADLLISAIEKLNLNIRLRRERDNAIAAEKSKSLFFATVSHDIRTPLNAILGFTELLQLGQEDADTRKKYLDSIAFSGNTLLQLLNDVLDLSKLEAGQIDFHSEICSFTELCNNMIAAFTPLAEEKGLTLLKKYADNMPRLKISFQRTRQILFNLLGNAIKFTEKGSITLEAEFTKTDSHAGTLVFSVIDTGRGIAKEDIPKLMKPFVQAQQKDQNFGTGLGLAICKSMLKHMDGSMSIQSELGKGSTFTVTMENIQFIEGNDMEANAKEALPDTNQNHDFSNLTLLIVDDSHVNIAVLKAMLKQFNLHKILTAESGQEAIDCLKSEKVDIVFTDLRMPEMSGIELAEHLRNDMHLDVPIVLVTADVEAPKDYKALGITSMLLKPITINLLKEQLNSLFNSQNKE